ncbi:MAG: NERD domain-containing protein [Muribaculaceae bacterium]|nr:NERD domain-containing protein [Muribaculaceae bacterium]
MQLNLIIGILIGVTSMLLLLVGTIQWKKGRAQRKGKQGEHFVSRELKKLKKSDYITLNDLLLPTAGGNTSQIDHVVVSSRGIFVIETKNLAGRIYGSENSHYWQQRMADQSRTIYNPLIQNEAHIRVLRRILKDISPEYFFSVIVFTDATYIDVKAEDIIRKRHLLPDKHILRTFMPSERRAGHWWRPGREIRLDETKVIVTLDELLFELNRRKRIIDRKDLNSICEKIQAVAIVNKDERRRHTEYVKATSASNAQKIKQGICPRCGGRLVVRRTDNGEFMGCENYPRCRFTCSTDRVVF